MGRVRWGQERGRGRRSGPSPNAHDGPYVNSDLPECVHSAWVETRTDGTECQIEHVCSTRMEKIEWKSPSLSFFVDISFRTRQRNQEVSPRMTSPVDSPKVAIIGVGGYRTLCFQIDHHHTSPLYIDRLNDSKLTARCRSYRNRVVAKSLGTRVRGHRVRARLEIGRDLEVDASTRQDERSHV